MAMNIAQKLIQSHLLEGEMIPGQEIGLRVDQTLNARCNWNLSHAGARSNGP